MRLHSEKTARELALRKQREEVRTAPGGGEEGTTAETQPPPTSHAGLSPLSKGG